MPTDTPTTFTLSLQAGNDTKPGSYQLPVKLTYFDNLRNPLSTTIYLNVNIVQQTTTTTTRTSGFSGTGIGLFSIALFIVIAVIMLGIGYLVGKRTRK
jgi:hypothetical protein